MDLPRAGPHSTHERYPLSEALYQYSTRRGHGAAGNRISPQITDFADVWSAERHEGGPSATATGKLFWRNRETIQGDVNFAGENVPRRFVASSLILKIRNFPKIPIPGRSVASPCTVLVQRLVQWL